MRTLNQPDRAAAGQLNRVDLLVLDVFTDYDAETVDTTYYWSSRPVVYPWEGGASQHFEPRLIGASPVSVSHAHMPQPDALFDLSGMDVALSNAEIEGSTLWGDLRTRNYLGAKLTVASVLLDPVPADERAWIDLRSFAGTEHEVWWRGYLTNVGAVTRDAVALSFGRRRAVLDFGRAYKPSTNDPRDLGVRLPIAVGSAKRVRAVNWTVGSQTTLAQVVTKTSTGAWKFTDVSGFGTSGTFWLSGEEIAYSGKSVTANTLTITGRGQGGTNKIEHHAGEVAIEVVSQVELLLNGVPSKALKALYMLNPINGELFRVTDPVNVTLSDPSLIAGRTCTVARLSSSDLRSILSKAENVARVTQQPDFSGSASDVVEQGHYLDGFGNIEWFSAPAELSNAEDDMAPKSPSGSGLPFAIWLDGNLSGPDGDIFKFENFSAVPSGLGGQMEVKRFRVTFSWNKDADNPPDGNDSLAWALATRLDTVPGYGFNDQIASWTARLIQNAPYTEFTAWLPVPAGTTIDQMRGADFYLYGLEYPQSSWNFGVEVNITDFKMELEVVVDQQITQTQDAEITAQQQGFGLTFFADLDGAPIPPGPPQNTLLYGFNTAAGWSVKNGSALSVVTGTEGAGALRIERGLTLVHACDNLTDWSEIDASNGVMSLDGSPLTEGSDAIKLEHTGGANYSVKWQPSADQDWSGAYFAVDIQADATLLGGSSTDAVRITFYDASGNFIEARMGSDHLAAGSTHTFFVAVGDSPANWGYIEGHLDAGFDPSQIDRVEVNVRKTGVLLVDWLRLTAADEIVQRTDLGAIDVDGDAYVMDARVEVPPSTDVLLDCDTKPTVGSESTPDGWYADLDVDTFVLVGSALTEGSDSLKLSSIDSAQGAVTWLTSTPWDMSGKDFAIDYRPNQALADLAGPGISTLVRFWLRDTGGNWQKINITHGELPSTVSIQTVRVPAGEDPAQHGYPYGTIDAGFDPSAVELVWVSVDGRSGIPLPPGQPEIEFDNIRTISVGAISTLVLSLSDEQPSGTASPAESRALTPNNLAALESASLVEDAALDASDNGAPDLANARTLRIRILWPPDGADAAVELDNLRAQTTPNTDYSGSVGDLIENPADVARYVLEELAVPAQPVDDASHSAAFTARSGAKLAGDLRDAGGDLESVLARIGHDGFLNLVRDEGSAGLAWKMLTPETTGGTLPVLSVLDGLSESSKDLELLAGKFEALYAPNAATSELLTDGLLEGYLRADTGQNDLSGNGITAQQLSDALAAYGASVASIVLPLVHDDATAKKIAALYVAALTDGAVVWTFREPFWSAYGLQVGDRVKLDAARIPWRSTDPEARIISITKSRDESVQLVVRELP